ncbi:efflux RND transporter permease subunit [Rhodoplanes sp. TEM]|uniref:Efflux RND transporter permease subunit n=1 Tax=Rhodoplanes tepidamans TaxID=200616 RepID=A0ABT5J4C7_RHOTP|nr:MULTISPECIES: efflux RND transporter permease subunit [Rhodoplanes]MDC7784481.1 efflux RND transporter permease subunit [Rhodoplanes tepidamans]MDC7983511.1 efflux RND transporter permease subunit [Rhodoplanes sp. TEM]MDQ0356989.1 hydrophobe/amphiphile efflux-1 (HAE1) family protein [Rhodoplanes tepidamans]
MNISAWSIRTPLPAVVFSIIIVMLGWMSFVKLPITRLPSVDVPIVSVAVAQFGASPAELEAQVTKTIEDAVASIVGVNHIDSTISDGLSVTTITFLLDADPDRALNDVKDAATRVRSSLPSGITEPLVQRQEVIPFPIMTYAAISPGRTPEQLSWFVDDVIKRNLQGLRGVAKFERIGGADREILVSLDPDRLQAVGLTAAGISEQLLKNNVDVAGGRAEIGGRDQSIRTIAGAPTIEALAGTTFSLLAGGEVRLDDLGVVTDTVVDPRTFARLDGDPVVAFSVYRAKGASDVRVSEAVEREIAKIKDEHPDVDVRLIDSSVDFTRANYDNAMQTLLEGALLTIVVVFLFLRDWRATAIAAIALPLSVFPAFWVMDMLGFSLNLVTLLAITLSTGILVDDAIVEIENIERHIQMGKSPYDASMEAADEIGLAVIAISLAIVAMFLPASFMPGIAGQFFKQFGVTVSVQVLFSLVVARLVTPMLAAYFLRPKSHAEKPPGAIMRIYVRVLEASVRMRYLTLLAGLAVFAASLWGLTLLPSGFLPQQDVARSLLAVELPPGTPLSDTEAVTRRMVEIIRKRPEVRSVFVDGGRIPPKVTEVNTAALIINYVPKKERKVSQAQLEQTISRDLADVPDVRYWFLDENGQRVISRIVTGQDGATVANVAAELANQMRRLSSISNVVSTAALDRPELRIVPRKALATRLNVNTETLAATVRVATIGDVGPRLAKFNVGDRLVPIRVMIEDTGRADRQVLEQLRVPTLRGTTVPLLAIADIQLGQGPAVISRHDRERQVKIEADLVGHTPQSRAEKEIDALPVIQHLPKGVRLQPSADSEAKTELLDGFPPVMAKGMVTVYAVLVLLFHSFLQPITILFSLPLSIGGAVIALLLTGNQLDLPVSIGLLMLMGIVTKNAIMLVDFAIESMARGMGRDGAIIDAGQKRARPIIMTTIAMVAGMTPAALGIGAGGEFRSPMATAVIGGLIVSTLLSLLFVPAVFTVMDDIGRGFGRIFGRLVTGTTPHGGGHGGPEGPHGGGGGGPGHESPAAPDRSEKAPERLPERVAERGREPAPAAMAAAPEDKPEPKRAPPRGLFGFGR